MSITIDFIIYTTDVCDIFLCICHVTMRCPGSGMVLDCICLLPFLFYSHKYRLTRNTVYCDSLSEHSGWLPIRYAYFILYNYLTISPNGLYLAGD